MEISEKKTIAVIIVLLSVGWFYWFQWRPAQIRNYCDQVAWNNAEIKTYVEKRRQFYPPATIDNKSEYVPLWQAQKQFLSESNPPPDWEEQTSFNEKVYDWKYVQCLHSRGLK